MEISVNLVLSAVVAVATLGGSWFVVKYKVNDLLRKQADLDIKYDTYAKRVEDVRAKSAHELAEFKLEVAKEYATTNAIHSMEDRLIQEMHALRDIFLNNKN